MIIDDSVSFFGVYYHNCIFNLGLSESFKDLYEKHRYFNLILCQKDNKGGYLLTQSITLNQGKRPNMQSFYFKNINELKVGFKKISNKIKNSDKIFYLLRMNSLYDMDDSEELVKLWKKEVKKSLNNEK